MASNTCGVCHQPIHLMCRKGTGICSEKCEKAKTSLNGHFGTALTLHRLPTGHRPDYQGA